MNPVAKKRTFVSVWFLVSSLVVFWDTFYVALRPRSMPGGDLHKFFSPYDLLIDVDYQYGWPAYNSNDGFVKAQAAMNMLENFLNILYLVFKHTSKPKDSSTAIVPLIGFSAALLTLAKTLIYILVDYFCGPDGWCKTGHNSWTRYFFIWMLPNLPWIFVPTYIVLTLGKDVVSLLKAGHIATTQKTKSK